MTKSNYIFKGVNVSIREHWTGEWEVFNSRTGEILFLVKDLEQALEIYDKMNTKE